MATLTFTDKQIRKMEKKARHNDGKFRNTQDKQYLWKADDLRKKAKKLSENQKTDIERMKRKVKESKKTDDQLINEAMRQNRRERNEAEKKMKEKDKKEKELLDRRNQVMLIMKGKQEEKKKQEEEEDNYRKELEQMKGEFIKEYLEKNEGHTYSQAHKEFNRNLYKGEEWKKELMELIVENGKKERVNCEEIVINESPRL